MNRSIIVLIYLAIIIVVACPDYSFFTDVIFTTHCHEGARYDSLTGEPDVRILASTIEYHTYQGEVVSWSVVAEDNFGVEYTEDGHLLVIDNEDGMYYKYTTDDYTYGPFETLDYISIHGTFSLPDSTNLMDTGYLYE